MSAAHDASVADVAIAPVGPEFFYPDLPIEQLRPSVFPENPRKRFAPEPLLSLKASILVHGILEPLVARRVDDHYEIICGERRWRAATLACVTTVPVMVRCLTDTQALEVMVVENKQREDVDALEEADGFRRLLDTGYPIETLAARIGLSRKYVYDRIKLLQLIPEAQELMAAGRITAGHAILLTRLKPHDQARAIDPLDGGLFYNDGEDPSDEDPYRGSAAISVREFDAWIERHVRLDLSKPVTEDDFPAVARAQEMAARVVSITHEHFLDARQQEGAAAGDRILLATEWKRADGATLADVFDGRKVTHPGCEKSLLGVVVIGRDRGTTFPVCVDRACAVHWSKQERAEAKRRESEPQSFDGDDDDEARQEARAEERTKAEQRFKAQRDREEAERAAYRTGAPAILAAFVAHVKKAKPGPLADAVSLGAAFHPKALAAFPKPKSAEDLLRIIAVSMVAEGLFNEWSAPQQVPLWAKRFGLDLKPLLKPAKTAVHASAQKKPAAKKKAGKGRR